MWIDTRATKRLVTTAMLALTVCACAALTSESPVPIAAPTQSDIARLTPSGRVTLSEVFVAGGGVGKVS